MDIETPGSRTALIKHWRVVKDPDGQEVDDDLRKPPEGMFNPLPPEKRSATQIKHRLAELGI